MVSSITPLPQARWVLFEQTCYVQFPWLNLCLLISEKRNSLGKDRLFLRQGNPVFDYFVGLYEGDGMKEVKELGH